ncbi:acid protease [Phellopilus nigrolimitatus]|nr:acid protease [Phellopilus nigrolimitatus]KAH8109242.1 acid protease [Phellopilus nigrolimitatus]
MASQVKVHSLPIATQLKHTGNAKSFIDAERARVAKFVKGYSPHGPNVANSADLKKLVSFAGNTAANTDSTIDVTDAGVTYTLQVGVGSADNKFNLLIDTGSSNTWVGASKKYTPTSTSQDTKSTIKVSYGSGSFSGEEYIDKVFLSSDLVIQKQGLGVATTSQGFTGQDGILGIGPVDLTQGTVSDNKPVPTVTDNLFAQKTISTNSIGISYEPTTSSSNVANGELTFGGTDSTKFTGSINYVDITSTSPASRYWGIDQSITYGSADGTQILKETAGIVDTGTTLLYLATDAYKAYQTATGGTPDQTTGLLKISDSQYQNLKSLFFKIGGTTYEFTRDAQIWPRSLNSKLGGSSSDIYLVAADNGSNSGQGLDFINGFAWLQRFYTVFDTQNRKVGIATTSNTNATTNYGSN